MIVLLSPHGVGALYKVSMQDLYCCFHCGRLAANLPTFKGCSFARFCSHAYQKAAWPAHQAACKNKHLHHHEEVDEAAASLLDILQVRSIC
jgi:MYND finger